MRLQCSDPFELPFSKIKLVDARGGVTVPVEMAIGPAKAMVAAIAGAAILTSTPPPMAAPSSQQTQ